LAQGNLCSLTPREAAIVTYAKKLTMTPWDMKQADVNTLRSAGLTDREVLDLAHLVSYWGYVNRLVAGLGVRLEDQFAHIQ